jgi:hypothetical protein
MESAILLRRNQVQFGATRQASNHEPHTVEGKAPPADFSKTTKQP